MNRQTFTLFFAAALATIPTPAAAGWKLMAAGTEVRVDAIAVRPARGWNQASSRPGKQGRSWTQDGLSLNAVEFFSAVPSSAPLYKERSRKHDPMPKFHNRVLLPELAEFFERSFRAANQISDFTIVETGGTTLLGQQGLRLRYRYSLPNDELTRLGEARLAVIGGKLYAINYYAPQLHYFEAGLPEATAMMDSARL